VIFLYREVDMDYTEYGQDELKSLLARKATELFKACDKDDKGYITQDDLLELTKELALTTEQIQSAFVKLDKDGNKFLTLDEFIDGFGVFLGVEHDSVQNPETERRQQKAKEAFDLCDEECKGYVTKQDLMRLTEKLGITVDQVGLIFDQLDGDQNGFLTLYEFTQGFSEYFDRNSVNEDSPSQHRCDMENYSDNQKTIYEKQQSLDQIDSKAKALINNIDECIGDSLTKENLAELWKSIQKTDTTTLTRFEEFLLNLTNEIKKAKLETIHLENTLKRKSLSHDIEVQKLFEEMEQQIKNEKAKIRELEARREKVIREEMKTQLQDKDYQLSNLLVKQRELEDRLFEVQQHEQTLKQENVKLVQQNSELEEQLSCSISSLEDTRSYVSSLQASSAQENRDHLRAAMLATEGIQQEHESLIRQLDMLREMNQRLRDDKDAIESSMKMQADRTSSIDEEIHNAEGRKAPLTKSGSIMSVYFSTNKRGRSRTKNYLQKQGSLMSSYFEPNRGSQESLVYGENTIDESYPDSCEEDEQKADPEIKRRVIRAVDENGEFVSSTVTDSPMNIEYDSYDHADGQHNMISSTPIREVKDEEFESPTRRRRLLPTRHGGSKTLYNENEEDVIGHIKELRRKLSNEHELNETDRKKLNGTEQNNDDSQEVGNANLVLEDASNADIVVSKRQSVGEAEIIASDLRNGDHKVYEREDHGEHTPLTTEDQMSATESEADRIMLHLPDDDAKEQTIFEANGDQRQQLKEMLDDLATPYAHKNLSSSDENATRIDEEAQDFTMGEEEGPPASPNRLYKIVFVGDSGVGKSSLIHRFCFNQFKTNFSATIGVDFQVKTVKVFQEWVALQLWDTAGQERFRSITKQYFRKADGVIIMFDLCSETSFKNVRNWMNSVEDSAEPECSVMLLGNKVDLAQDDMRKVTTEVGQKLAQDFSCSYAEVSAKSAQGVNEAMIKMARLLADKEDSIMKLSVLNLDFNSEGKKKKGCCSK